MPNSPTNQIQLSQVQAKTLDTKKFQIEMQGFAYCPASDWSNGNCLGTQQFIPGKAPLHIWLSYLFDQSFINSDIDASFIFQTVPDGKVIWDFTGRVNLKFADGMVSISLDTTTYPAELKSLPKGRYTLLSSILTTDGVNYSERLLPFIIR